VNPIRIAFRFPQAGLRPRLDYAWLNFLFARNTARDVLDRELGPIIIVYLSLQTGGPQPVGG
jgi:hypothetical protein